LRSLEVWVPEVTASTSYKFTLLVKLPNTDDPVGSIFEPTVLLADAWNILGVGNEPYPEGTVFTVIIDSINSSANTTWEHIWDYAGIQNAAGPANGLWNRRQQQDVIRINTEDSSAVDQTADLAAVLPGSVIRTFQTNNPGNFWEYYVTDFTNQGAYYEYDVNLLGSGGAITVLAPTSIKATIPTPLPTLYSKNTDWWVANQPAFADVIGLAEEGGSPFGTVNDAYGIRMGFQEGVISADWQVVAYSG
jgi:hypothetical protein